MQRIALSFLVAALAACATDDGSGLPQQRVSYSCERGGNITVEYAGDTARLYTGESTEPIVLPRRVSASGFWYDSGRHAIRGGGGEISYTIGRSAPMTCQPITPLPR